jgi:two-component system, cell cycle response regulator
MQIALIEPSRTVQSALVQLLETRGHVPRAFDNPYEALDRLARDERFDAVITAAELSPISGMEVCWEARLIAGEYRPLYIMLMTSSADEKTMIECLDMGADEIILKPPSKNQLFARLRAGERSLRLQRELIRLALTDPMTGLLNRRAFFEKAAQLCKEKATRLSAILFDIDHFKDINDFYGHETGDRAICAVSQQAVCNQHVVGRLGGDEICILLKGSGVAQAWDMAEELRCRIGALEIATPEGSTRLTCSFGVSELRRDADIDDLLRDADMALYRAKREGRDCVSTPPSSEWLSENPPQASNVIRWKPRRV